MNTARARWFVGNRVDFKGLAEPAERPWSHEEDVNLLKTGDPGPPKYIAKTLPE